MAVESMAHGDEGGAHSRWCSVCIPHPEMCPVSLRKAPGTELLLSMLVECSGGTSACLHEDGDRKAWILKV